MRGCSVPFRIQANFCSYFWKDFETETVGPFRVLVITLSHNPGWKITRRMKGKLPGPGNDHHIPSWSQTPLSWWFSQLPVNGGSHARYCPAGVSSPQPTPPGHYVGQSGSIYPSKCRPGTYAANWLMMLGEIEDCFCFCCACLFL